MKITFDVSDEKLTDNEKEIIKKALGVEDETKLKENLSKIAKTAFLEYKGMIADNGVATRATDILENRLLLLVYHFFQDRIPTETEISSIFLLTDSRSKSLLKNFKSRYRNKIEKHLEKSIKKFIKSGNKDDETKIYEFKNTSKNLVDHLNEIIRKEKPGVDLIKSISGKAGKVKCSIDTYNFLSDRFNIVNGGES